MDEEDIDVDAMIAEEAELFDEQEQGFDVSSALVQCTVGFIRIRDMW
jgi:hypothetical protein